MIDIHSHILPFLDDGSVSWEEAIEQCRIAYDDGIRTIVATPHIINGRYPNTKEKIRTRVEELRDRIDLPLSILEGAEVRASEDLVTRVKDGIIPTINGKHYLLLELPFNIMLPNIESLVFDLQINGMIPVLAHPERYLWIKGNLKPILSRFVDVGMVIQMNASSITGDGGEEARIMALEMLRSGLVHVVASDSHSATDRPPVISSALTIMESIIGSQAKRLVFDNPEKIVMGLPVI